MTNHPAHFLRLGILTALLAGACLAQAQNGAIRDTAAFFSESSKAEAARNITELGRRFRKDLVIETFREIPETVRQGVNLQDKPAVNRLFEQWPVQQAKQHRVNGIYILLTKEPAHLQIVVGNETQNNAFTLKDRDALASLMLARLRAKQNDEALVEGVNFVTTTMASHAAARTRPSPVAVGATTAPASRSESSGGLSTILLVVLGLAVVWLVVGVFRSLSRSGGGASAGAGGGAVSSGGGFFSSLLGGMFGAAAGMWLYDQFSGHSGSAWGANQDHSSSGEGGFSGRDSDYSSSGGDFSSGDSGGGDSGGGDF